jgi:hypothetical protein
MGIFSKQMLGVKPTDRRHFPRRHTGEAQVYLYASGENVQRCKVYDISRAGMFVETTASLPLDLTIELAFTCLYTRHIVRMYRRSGYVARISENGIAVLFIDREDT